MLAEQPDKDTQATETLLVDGSGLHEVRNIPRKLSLTRKQFEQHKSSFLAKNCLYYDENYVILINEFSKCLRT